MDQLVLLQMGEEMTLTYEQAQDLVQRQLRRHAREVNRLIGRGWLKRPLRFSLTLSHPMVLRRPYGVIFDYEPTSSPSEGERKIILPHLKPFLVIWESGEVVMLGMERSIEDDLVFYDIKYGGGKPEITLSEAQQIAENFWFPNETDQQDKAFRKLEVRQVEELQRPYGWVFVYDTREWWETKDPETRDRFAPLSGACLILRKGGIAVYLGTYAPFERQLQEYEHFLYGVPT